jgi:cytochrome c553
MNRATADPRIRSAKHKNIASMSLNRTFLRGAAAVCAVGAMAAFGASAQTSAATKPDAAKGQKIAGDVCAACHAADGNSVASANPKLAGQHPEYVAKQLVDFARKPDNKSARVSGVMAGFAASLSAEDRRNLGAWFASQKPKPGTAKNKETLEFGARIYRAGIPEKSVPACSGCHSPNGAGIPAQYPRLSGQFAEYIEAQLKAFRDGTRRNSVPMMQTAARLSDREMAAVADYIAGLR